jgi:hypothetical protein
MATRVSCSGTPALAQSLRARHLLVPHDGVVAALLDRHVGEGNRERPDRADHVDPVAEAVHVFELLVEIEPLRPGIEMLAAGGSAHVVVAAALVDPGLGEFAALAQLVENRAGPPMEMRVDDVHGTTSCGMADEYRSILERGGTPVNVTHPHAHGVCVRFLQ